MYLENAIPNPWSMLPFGVLLAAMAMAPLLAPGWWQRHYPKVAGGLGLITVIYYLGILHAPSAIGQAAHEYLSFTALVGGLFVVAGGIHLGIKGPGTPLINLGFLLAGAVLANVLGTTGAAMLLIRPWIRLNQARIRPYHIVFFIFIVANAGGCLTPIGDPPLFLGYLQGVPFWWVLKHCWPMWVLAVGLLLAIFYMVDWWHAQMDRGSATGSRPPANANPGLPTNGQNLQITGRANFFFLAIMLAAIFIDHPPFLRESIMLAAAIASWRVTPKSVHEANGFNFHPLVEVAILFAGIFATMTPALAWLQLHASDVLGPAPSPASFFWGTGLLSTVLDNAPTYLADFSCLAGITHAPDTGAVLLRHGAEVMGISLGAVFFGAATYIGNGPNFMIRDMARQAGIPMPSFLGLVLKYSLPCLLPVLALVWLVFFRE